VRFTRNETPSTSPFSSRALEHALGDVDADALVEPVRECARHPAETAAEVEGAPSLLRIPELGDAIHQSVDLEPSGGEELVAVPTPESLSRRGQDAQYGSSSASSFQSVRVV
jgi:hypothetical protein